MWKEKNSIQFLEVSSVAKSFLFSYNFCDIHDTLYFREINYNKYIIKCNLHSKKIQIFFTLSSSHLTQFTFKSFFRELDTIDTVFLIINTVSLIINMVSLPIIIAEQTRQSFICYFRKNRHTKQRTIRRIRAKLQEFTIDVCKTDTATREIKIFDFAR